MSASPLSTNSTTIKLTSPSTSSLYLRALLAKELVLQRSALMFLAGVLLVWSMLRVLSIDGDRQVAGFKMEEIVASLHLMAVQFPLLVILPLMFGATSVARERKLGVLDWQLALPKGRARQFGVKAAVVLALSIFTGGILTLWLDRLLPATDYLQRGIPGVWPGLYAALLACVGMLASVVYRDETRAMVGSLPLLACFATVYLADPAFLLLPPLGMIQDSIWVEYVRFALLSALLLFFAVRNYRPLPISRRLLVLQHGVLALAVFVVSLWAVHAVRRVDLAPAASMQALQPHVQYRTLVADSAARYGARVQANDAKDSPYRLNLIAGKDSSWKEALAYPDEGVRFSDAFYRSPEGRLVGKAGMIGPHRTVMSKMSLDMHGTWFDVDLSTNRIRQYPGAPGNLVGFRDGHQYVLGPWLGTFVAGAIPLITYRIGADEAFGSSEVATDGTVAAPPGFEPVRDQLLGVQHNPPTGGFRTYRIKDAKKFMVSPNSPDGLVAVGGRAAHWPKHLVLTRVGEELTSGTAMLGALFALDEEERTAKLVDLDPYYDWRSGYFVSSDGRWFARKPRWGLEEGNLQVRGITSTGELTGTSWTIPSEGKQIITGVGWQNTWELTSYTLVNGDASLLTSPDGQFLAAMRMQKHHNTINPDKLIATGWHEVVTLNLNSGEVRTVGGFPPSESYQMSWKKREEIGRRPDSTEKQNQQWYYDGLLYEPLLAWSPDGKLAALNGSDLYLFDPADKSSEPQFVHVDIDRTVSSNLAFWDKNTLLLMGSRSVWKLAVNPD